MGDATGERGEGTLKGMERARVDEGRREGRGFEKKGKGRREKGYLM